MVKFLAQKLGMALAVMLGLVGVVFVLFMAMPSPEQILSGQRGDSKTKAAIMADLSLDKPPLQRFTAYLNDLSPLSYYPEGSQREQEVSGMKIWKTRKGAWWLKWPWLRKSFYTKQPVSNMISEAFTGTLLLAGAAMLIAAFIGIPLGVWVAGRQGTILDKCVVGLSTLGISVPSFFSSMLVAWGLGYVWKEYTGLSMTGSWQEVDALGEGSRWVPQNIILPALALGVRPLSVFIQLTRNSMAEVLPMDYIKAARSRGLTERKVMWRHALPNAMNPVVTAASGWFASLLAGAFFTEYIFNWKGLGKVTIEALQQSDLPVIMGTVLFTALLFVFINVLVEMMYFWLDPRIRKTA